MKTIYRLRIKDENYPNEKDIKQYWKYELVCLDCKKKFGSDYVKCKPRCIVCEIENKRRKHANKTR
jgi:rRNA maturation endonuclease Nob1